MAGTMAVIKYWPRIKPDKEVSELYSRLAQRGDLTVSFIKAFHIGDITVDVTVVTAKDSAGWERLQEEVNVPQPIIDDHREEMRKGNYPVVIYYCEKNRPETRTTTKSESFDYVFLSSRDMTLYAFDVKSLEQAKAINHLKINENFK